MGTENINYLLGILASLVVIIAAILGAINWRARKMKKSIQSSKISGSRNKVTQINSEVRKSDDNG